MTAPSKPCEKCGCALTSDTAYLDDDDNLRHITKMCLDVVIGQRDEAIKALEAVSGICFRITRPDGESSFVARQHAIAIGGVVNAALERLRGSRG